MKPSEYIDKTMKELNVKNDHQMALRFGWTDSKVNNYRHNRQGLDNEASRQIAVELEIPVIKIIADMEAFRAERKEDMKSAREWKKLSKIAGYASTNLLIVLSFLAVRIQEYILC